MTAYPNATFTGTVAAIEPAGTTTSNVVTYTVLISVDPTDVQLLPGMTATVTIVTAAANDTIPVPNTAITYASKGQTGGTVVDVLRDGVATPVQVQTGITDGINTQTVSGLAAGDPVVTGVASATTAGRARRLGRRAFLAAPVPAAPAG